MDDDGRQWITMDRVCGSERGWMEALDNVANVEDGERTTNYLRGVCYVLSFFSEHC